MEFKVVQKELELKSRGWIPTFHDVSKEVLEIVKESGVKNGTVCVASHHTTCSVMIQEASHDLDSFDLEYLQHDLDAYKEGLKNSLLIEKKAGRRVRVCCDYNTMGKVQYQAAQNGIALLDTQYADTVEMVMLVPEREIDYVTKLLTEATNARASLYVESPVWFAAVEKEILLFDH